MRWIRHRIEGKYGLAGGEWLAARLTANDGGGRTRVAFDERYIKDHQLDDLQDRISRAVADRMQTELDEDGCCQRTSRLRFTTDGLQVRPLFGTGRVKSYPWHEIKFEVLLHGMVRIAARRGQITLARLMPSTSNLYPGLELLTRLSAVESEPSTNTPQETVLAWS